MNRIIIKAAVSLLALVLVLPGSIKAQEKKVHIKKVIEENGEKVVIDTVFTIKEGEKPEDFIKTYEWVSDGDSSKTFTFDVKVDKDFDVDTEHKVIIMKDGDDIEFITDKEIEHKIKIIKDGDHENFFVYSDADFDFDTKEMEKIQIEMKKVGEEMEKMKIELDGEMIILAEELAELDEIKELEKLHIITELEDLKELEELKKIEVFMNDRHHGDHAIWFHNNHHINKPSEKEIRDAGIKVKANRLDLETIDVNIDNGIVDLEFTIEGDASPRVVVYNFYGNKIAGGKPELMNGKYVMKIDLSGKQHGTYYLQIETKDSSTIQKLRL